jgi:hypothetical protein
LTTATTRITTTSARPVAGIVEIAKVHQQMLFDTCFKNIFRKVL